MCRISRRSRNHEGQSCSDTALSLPVKGNELITPLTPPLSDRASRDMEELYSPEKEEHYESVDLSNEDSEEWNLLERQATSIDDPNEV